MARLTLRGWPLLALLLAPLPQSAQPSSTGVIAGVVVDQSTGRGVADAIVTLALGTGAAGTSVPQRVMTDPSGRFAFAGLPAATLIIQAAKPGYVATANVTVDLRENDRVTNATMTLARYSSISGRVLDDLGDPVVGVTVRAHRRGYEGGHPHFDGGAPAQTDDRGVYRMGFLTPGDYIVAVPAKQASIPAPVMKDYMSGKGGALTGAFIDVMGIATVSSINGSRRVGNFVLQSPMGTYYPPDSATLGRAMAYQTIFAPAATNTTNATVIALQPGEQRTGVDVQLTLVPTVTVSGSVTGPDGPAPFATLGLMIPGSDLPDTADSARATAMADATGEFTFLNVPAGTYVLRATKRAAQGDGLPESYRLASEQPLAVGDAPIAGISVMLKKPFLVRGRVEFEGGMPSTPDMDRLRGDQPLLIVTGADERQQSAFARQSAFAIADAAGTFTTGPLNPGRYVVVSTVRSPTWRIKSAMWQGKDLTRSSAELKEDVSGLVVTFTEKPAGVTGTVRTADGAPDSTASVLLFPVDSKAWADYGEFQFQRQLQRTSTTLRGTYAFSKVPSGDYYVVAAVEAPRVPAAIELPGVLRDWLNPAFLSAVSRVASRVRVTDGEIQTMDLKTVSVR